MKNEIIKKIEKIVSELDELDDYFEELPNYQSKVDSLISDYRHLIRENDVTKIAFDKIIPRMQEAELQRKKLKQDFDLSNIYNKCKSRLISKENRQFLLSELYKKEKNFDCQYNYRVLTESEINDLLGVEKRKRGRPKKEEKNEKI